MRIFSTGFQYSTLWYGLQLPDDWKTLVLLHGKFRLANLHQLVLSLLSFRDLEPEILDCA